MADFVLWRSSVGGRGMGQGSSVLYWVLYGPATGEPKPVPSLIHSTVWKLQDLLPSVTFSQTGIQSPFEILFTNSAVSRSSSAVEENVPIKINFATRTFVLYPFFATGLVVPAPLPPEADGYASRFLARDARLSAHPHPCAVPEQR